ncbi:MAG: C25 family cysteine peptidase [Candidatus Cloacimonetes bacterium]|nr:C25 family cysteine peptidase [Candidatus Cloacimonadota bacterium]
MALGLLCLVATLAANPWQTLRSDNSGITLRLNSPELQINSTELRGESFQELSLEGANSALDTGAPDLPSFSGSIILPPNGSYSLQYRSLHTREYAGIHPFPVQSKDAAPRRDYRPELYESHVNPSPLLSGGVSVIRDFRVLQFVVNPLNWNPLTGTLSHADELEIEIRFNSSAGENEVSAYTSYSPAFRHIYEANLLNFDDYRSLNTAEDPGRILLIHWNNQTTEFTNMLNAYIAWKRQKGHEVNAVNTQAAGGSNSAIKSYIQNQYNNPATRPDFVILLGDTGYIPTFSNGGDGDYPYTFLAGNDMLGDAMIGRISVENITHMAVLLSKIFRYERDLILDTATSDYLNRMLLVGDPGTSGISCVYISKYVRDLAKQVNPDYSFVEAYSGSYSTTMNTGINQGVNFFTYRGWIGMSSWSPSENLSNGHKMPHAVILTCSTGNFGSTSTTESFVRLGTAANPKGAVSAIGMATSSTHTMPNNALLGGIFNGIFTYNMRNMGAALLNGRLFLRQTYGASHTSIADQHAHWCNLIGDPSMEAFVGTPQQIEIEMPESIALGSDILDIQIRDASSNPIPNVCVTAFSNSSNSVIAKAFSNEDGYVHLDFPLGITENLLITASKPDHKPTQLTISIASGGPVARGTALFDDGNYESQGNGDGIASGGETIAILVNLKNTGNSTIEGLSGTATSPDAFANIISNSINFPSLAPNEEAFSEHALLVELAGGTDGSYYLHLLLELTDSEGNSYNIPVRQIAHNAHLEIEVMNLSAGGNSILDPTETGTIQFGLKNTGIVPAQDLFAQLSSQNDLLVINESESYVGDIACQALGFNQSHFEVFARSLLIPGMQMPLKLRLYNDSGFQQEIPFNLSIGTVTTNTPLGPDAYGYFIYDESDINFADCPTYEWIEIHPSLGGSGSKLTSLNDSGTSGDEGETNGSTAIQIIPLPFPFTFYGIPYTEISVCTNGFIVFGQTGNAEFRNCRLPGGLGPAPMIAAFWDDLIQISDAGVYRYYDATEHIFIIQYHKMRNGYDRNSLETFQIILYDPMYHPTSLGDGKIKIQYKDFNNVDIGGGGYTPRHGKYATIGIKDHTNTRGLEYSYNNQYAPAAAPLGANKAILINTVPVLHQSPFLIVQDFLINDANGNGAIEPGERVELGIRLINQGLDTASEVQLSLETSNPYIQIISNSSHYPEIPGDTGAVNSYPLVLQVDWNCPAGTAIHFNINIDSATGSWTYPYTLQVTKPQIQIVNYCINDALGNANGLAEPGETFDLVVNFANNSTFETTDLTLSIFCLSEDVTIVNPDALIPCLKPGAITQAAFEISVSPDAMIGNNLTFFITYLGEQVGPQNEQLLISLGTTGMNEDFEYTNGNFVPSPEMNGWQWGISSYAGAQSGSKVWGTRLNDPYPGNAFYTLTTPSVYVGANFMLEFWHLYDTENSYDGGCVQVLSASSSSWNLLLPEGGYSHNNVSALGGAGFSGQSAGWRLSRFPLSQYENQNIRFRFVFASDGSVAGNGWFLDDVRTTGYIPFASKMYGQIISSDSGIDFSKVLVHSLGGINCYPDDSGYYQLYLPAGSHQIEALADGYSGFDPISITLSNEVPTLNQDFYLGELYGTESLSYNLVQNEVILAWDPPEPSEEYALLGYAIYRRAGGGLFELHDEVLDCQYTDTLDALGTYLYYVKCLYPEGFSRASNTVSILFDGMSNEDAQSPALTTTLKGNFPNPFNPSTTIAFSLAEPAFVKLDIFNLKGQKVARLVNEPLSSGTYNIPWQGVDNKGQKQSSGLYFIRLQTGSKSFTRKMMLMK